MPWRLHSQLPAGAYVVRIFLVGKLWRSNKRSDRPGISSGSLSHRNDTTHRLLYNFGVWRADLYRAKVHVDQLMGMDSQGTVNYSNSGLGEHISLNASVSLARFLGNFY